jgi:hypothetical protein
VRLGRWRQARLSEVPGQQKFFRLEAGVVERASPDALARAREAVGP